jgi:hypothetical protein
MERPNDLAKILGRTVALLGANAPFVILSIAIMTAVDWAGDQKTQWAVLARLLNFLVTLFVEYELILKSLDRCGYAVQGHGRRRFGALLGLNLVSGFGISLGLIFLILPGLYLIVRWSVSVPILIAEEAGVFDSLSRSREEAEGRFWTILALLLVVWVPPVAVAVGAAALTPSAPLAFGLVADVAVNLALVATWHAAVAIYVVGKPNGTAEVFA